MLREVDRVLAPEGHAVVLGFNPLSLWGLRRLFAHRVPVVVVTAHDLTSEERDHLSTNVVRVFDKEHLDSDALVAEMKRLLASAGAGEG